jgi:hypothetical protein
VGDVGRSGTHQLLVVVSEHLTTRFVDPEPPAVESRDSDSDRRAIENESQHVVRQPLVSRLPDTSLRPVATGFSETAGIAGPAP